MKNTSLVLLNKTQKTMILGDFPYYRMVFHIYVEGIFPHHFGHHVVVGVFLVPGEDFGMLPGGRQFQLHTIQGQLATEG